MSNLIPFDISYQSYYQYIDKKKIVNDISYHCITKDVLKTILEKLCSLDNSKLFKYTLHGKLNSSYPFPTWDIDFGLSSSTIISNDILLKLMLDIKNISLEHKIIIDQKYLLDINQWDNACNNPTILHDISQTCLDYSFNQLFDASRKFRVKTGGDIYNIDYYKSRIIKLENETVLDTSFILYLDNRQLPSSDILDSNYYTYDNEIYNLLLEERKNNI